MPPEVVAELNTRFARMRARQRIISIISFVVICLVQIPMIVVNGMVSTGGLLFGMTMAVVYVTLATVVTRSLISRWQRIDFAYMVIAKLMQHIPKSPFGEFGELRQAMLVLKLSHDLAGTEERRWTDGLDPRYGHPDFRRRRLVGLMETVAYRPLPAGVNPAIRSNLVAAAQLAIACEVLQSRSLFGRGRNAFLKVFGRRA